MIRPVILVAFVGYALSAPQGCLEPCILQGSQLSRNLDFSKPGNWSEHNEYDANGGKGKVHEEYGQIESENARVRYFRKNYTSSSRGGGQLGDHTIDQILINSRGGFQTTDTLPKEVQESIQQSLDRTRDQISQIREQTQQTLDQTLGRTNDYVNRIRGQTQQNIDQSLGRTNDYLSRVREQTQQTVDQSLQQARQQLEQSRDILSRSGLAQSRGQTENFGVRGLETSGSSRVEVQTPADFQSRDSLRTGGQSQVREYEERHEESRREETQKSYSNREVTSQQTVVGSRVPHYHYRDENGQTQQIVARNTNVGDYTNQNSNQNFHQSYRQPSGQFGVGVLDLKDDVVECDLDHDTQPTVSVGQVRRMRRKAERESEEDDSRDDSQDEEDEDDEFQQQHQSFDQVNSFHQQPARGQYDRTIGSFDSGRNYDSTTRQPNLGRPNYQINTVAPSRPNWFPRYHSPGTYNSPSEGEDIHVDENQTQEKVIGESSTARPFWPIASTARAEVDDMKEIMESLLIPDNYDSEEMRKAIGQIMKELNHTFYNQYGDEQVELKNNSESSFKQYEEQTQEPHPNLVKIAPNSGFSGYPQSNIQLNQNSNFNVDRLNGNENSEHKSQTYDGHGVNLDQQKSSPSSYDRHDEQQKVDQQNFERPSYVPERPQSFHNYHHNYLRSQLMNRYNDHPMAPGFHQIDVYQRPPKIYNPHEQPGIAYAPNPIVHPSVKVEQLIPVNKNWESNRMEGFNYYSNIHKEAPQNDQPYNQPAQNPSYDHRRGSSGSRPEYDDVQKPWSYNQRFPPPGVTEPREPQLGQGDINYPDKPYAFGRPYLINQRPEEHRPLCPVYPQGNAGVKTSRRPQMVPCDQLSTTANPTEHFHPAESSGSSRPNYNYRPPAHSHQGPIRSDDLEKYRGDIPQVEPLGGSTRSPATYSTTVNPIGDDNQQRQQGHDEGDYLQPPRQESQYPQRSSNPRYEPERNQPNKDDTQQRQQGHGEGDYLQPPRQESQYPQRSLNSRYDQERNQPQWPREIDSTTMRDNYNKFMGDLTNSEPYNSANRRPNYPRTDDQQQSDHQFRDSEVQVSTDLSLNNRPVYQNQRNQENRYSQRSGQQTDERQHEDHQISVRSDKLSETSTEGQTKVEPEANYELKPRILEAYAGGNDDRDFSSAKVNPSATFPPVYDGEDPWLVKQRDGRVERDERVVPLQAQPSAELQAPVELATEVTTPASPGFWKKLGNKITNTYDKAKEKAKEVFG